MPGKLFQPTVGVMEGRPRLVGDWQVSQLLGRGSFAAVFHATHATDGRQAAVKEIDTSKLTPKLRDSINTEAALLRQAVSPHIVPLWDTLQVRQSPVAASNRSRALPAPLALLQSEFPREDINC